MKFRVHPVGGPPDYMALRLAKDNRHESMALPVTAYLKNFSVRLRDHVRNICKRVLFSDGAVTGEGAGEEICRERLDRIWACRPVKSRSRTPTAPIPSPA